MISAPTIDVTINGEHRAVPPGQSVEQLLAWLEIPLDRVAVELNKSIVRKREWSLVKVPADARLEIVEFVGGG